MGIFSNIFKKLDKDGDGFELSDLKNIGDLGLDKLVKGDALKKLTNFGSLKDLLAKVGVSKPADLANVDKAKLDNVVQANSSFGSWKDLLAAAEQQLKK